MNDLGLAQFGGQHGFLLVEPRVNPAPYDKEFFLALHDWDGYLLGGDDGAMNPSYNVATINGRAMGFGEPLRVKQGQRVLLHILNSSPTEVHWVAFAGHTFRVIALDGNTVPAPREVPMLRLAPAERVSALVDMNNPGVWVLGEVRKHVQSLGMAISVEYENSNGPVRWQQPPDLVWNYEQFAVASASSTATVPRTGSAAIHATRPVAVSTAGPPIVIPLVFESKFRATAPWKPGPSMESHIPTPGSPP